jgi:hypothetical protein
LGETVGDGIVEDGYRVHAVPVRWVVRQTSVVIWALWLDGVGYELELELHHD